MATVSNAAQLDSNRSFSWVSDLVQKIKDLLTLPNPPELVPIPVRSRPRRPPPKR